MASTLTPTRSEELLQEIYRKLRECVETNPQAAGLHLFFEDCPEEVRFGVQNLFRHDEWHLYRSCYAPQGTDDYGTDTCRFYFKRKKRLLNEGV